MLPRPTPAACGTLTRNIELHPQYALETTDQPYPISLIIHVVRQFQQGLITALSVYGEL